MNLYVGTSGFSYKEWKGPFYPDKIKPADMLAFYSARLSSVEINNTFYRMPKTEVLKSWADEVPDDFRFVIKASRRITHFARLKEEAREPTEFLLKQVAELGGKLGVLLFQLPPNLKADLARLRDFLDFLPPQPRAAFEFRHDSWLDDAVLSLLAEHGAALCLADTEDGEPPLEATAPFGYLRLRRPDYDEAALQRWAERLLALGWDEAYVFFKHEDEAAGPKMAIRFAAVMAGVSSTTGRIPGRKKGTTT